MNFDNVLEENNFSDRAPVSLLWKGNLPCSQLVVHWNPSGQAKPEALLRAEKEFWRQKRKSSQNAQLFNGSLAELRAFQFQNEQLVLELSPTDYRAFLYSNFHGESIARTFGGVFLNQGLGISAIVRTRDGKIVLMKRSTLVGEYPNRLDVFGGHIHPTEHVRNGKPDPCQAIREEVREELNVKPEEINALAVRGLLRNVETSKPELVFSISLQLDHQKLSARAQNARDKFEWADLVFISDEKEEEGIFLQQHANDFSPSGFGSLLLDWL